MIEVDKEFDIDYLDPSSICSCNRCPAKHLFSRQMGLSMPDSPVIALDYGTDMHIAIPYC